MNKLSYNYPLKEHDEYFRDLPYKDNYVENSWLLIPTKLMSLIKDFILFKTTFGSNIEKNFYKDMTIGKMIFRLFKNRPLSFVGGADSWVLKDLTDGFGKWETIGTDKESAPLVLANLMSYDEIELSSFLSLSIFTPFINQGARDNSGRPDQNCQPNGIYIGQNGARFERARRMEWRYMIVDPDQNTIENGYGPVNVNTKNSHYLSMWAKFYDVPYFPLFKEAETDNESQTPSGRFYKLNTGIYLDTLIYKKRIKMMAELFLKEANYRAKKINKHAFCYVVGLGLGAWKLSSALDTQIIITVESYLELIRDGAFENVSDLYFGWFNIPKEFKIPSELNGIKIHVGHRNPAEPLNDQNKLLVANWAWDPNSYVGNEYWCGQLRTSGDPAACSSFIAYIANPDLCNISEVHHFNTSV
jgi:hypothetical protein